MYSYEYPHPAVAVDVVVFTIRENQLSVLLIQRATAPHKGKWALPGKFLDSTEDLDKAAIRALRQETGVSDVFLEQLYTFGKPKRDPRERVISVAYYALVPSDNLVVQATSDADAVVWHNLQSLPTLAFDHANIIAMAHQRLVSKLDYSTLAFQFLPESFTLQELQDIYQLLYQEELDKRNFRKWILGLDQLCETGKKRTGGAHRPAKLYKAKNPLQVSIIK